MPRSRSLLALVMASVGFAASMLVGIVQNQQLQAYLFGYDLSALKGDFMEVHMRVDRDQYTIDMDQIQLAEGVEFGKEGEWSWCDYSAPEGAELSVDLVAVELPILTFKNTGDVRLFGSASGCKQVTETELVSANQEGYESFYEVSGMQETHVEPGELFHFELSYEEPEVKDDVLREFFQAQVGDQLLDERFIVDLEMGEASEQMQDDLRFVTEWAGWASELEGQLRNFEIDLSEQKMWAKFGETRTWSMSISSGHWETPTPIGSYKILNKQELRIGWEAPRYRMPYWMGWRSDGYGIHGLPYLENDNGVFWEEAVEHLGTPVSHGCIRVGDKDVRTAYEFAEVGTPINIHR